MHSKTKTAGQVSKSLFKKLLHKNLGKHCSEATCNIININLITNWFESEIRCNLNQTCSKGKITSIVWWGISIKHELIKNWSPWASCASCGCFGMLGKRFLKKIKRWKCLSEPSFQSSRTITDCKTQSISGYIY